MNNLSQTEWNKYVKYALEPNETNQRFRIFGILLEDFDWAFEYAEGEAYQKGYQRQIDLRHVRDQLAMIDEKRAHNMYDQRSPWR